MKIMNHTIARKLSIIIQIALEDVPLESREEAKDILKKLFNGRIDKPKAAALGFAPSF